MEERGKGECGMLTSCTEVVGDEPYRPLWRAFKKAFKWVFFLLISREIATQLETLTSGLGLWKALSFNCEGTTSRSMTCPAAEAIEEKVRTARTRGKSGLCILTFECSDACELAGNVSDAVQ